MKTFPQIFFGERLVGGYITLSLQGGPMARALWNERVIAESDDVVEIEGNLYFPADSANKDFLSQSSHQTVCSWKGTASYFDVVVDGKKNENAAWYYPEPKSAAANIRGRLAFWKGVKVEK